MTQIWPPLCQTYFYMLLALYFIYRGWFTWSDKYYQKLVGTWPKNYFKDEPYQLNLTKFLTTTNLTDWTTEKKIICDFHGYLIGSSSQDEVSHFQLWLYSKDKVSHCHNFWSYSHDSVCCINSLISTKFQTYSFGFSVPNNNHHFTYLKIRPAVDYVVITSPLAPHLFLVV